MSKKNYAMLRSEAPWWAQLIVDIVKAPFVGTGKFLKGFCEVWFEDEFNFIFLTSIIIGTGVALSVGWIKYSEAHYIEEHKEEVTYLELGTIKMFDDNENFISIEGWGLLKDFQHELPRFKQDGKVIYKQIGKYSWICIEGAPECYKEKIYIPEI